MNNLCSKDRNILTQNFKAELYIKVNFELNRSQFNDFIKDNEQIINAAKH